MSKLLVIYASDIPTAVKCNPFASAADLSKDLVDTNNTAKVDSMMDTTMHNAQKDINEIANARLKQDESQEERLSNNLRYKLYRSLSEPFHFSSDIDKRLAQEINKAVGTIGKADILKRFLAKTSELTHSVIPTESILKYLPVPNSEYVIQVSGRANAIVYEQDGKEAAIIQVRVRQASLPSEVYQNEAVQMQIYMWLYNVSKVYYHEYCIADQTTQTQAIEYDEKLQQVIQDDLFTFAKGVFEQRDKNHNMQLS
jgi:hypothetical protein